MVIVKNEIEYELMMMMWWQRTTRRMTRQVFIIVCILLVVFLGVHDVAMYWSIKSTIHRFHSHSSLLLLFLL